jgi:hypothetical protein
VRTSQASKGENDGNAPATLRCTFHLHEFRPRTPTTTLASSLSPQRHFPGSRRLSLSFSFLVLAPLYLASSRRCFRSLPSFASPASLCRLTQQQQCSTRSVGCLALPRPFFSPLLFVSCFPRRIPALPRHSTPPAPYRSSLPPRQVSLSFPRFVPPSSDLSRTLRLPPRLSRNKKAWTRARQRRTAPRHPLQSAASTRCSLLSSPQQHTTVFSLPHLDLPKSTLTSRTRTQ